MLHPLNDDQLALLNEFKSSGLTMKEFVASTGIKYNSLAYIIWKQKRLSEIDSFNLQSFIPIALNNKDFNTIKEESNINDFIDIKINGFNISIKLDDLKELLK